MADQKTEATSETPVVDTKAEKIAEPVAPTPVVKAEAASKPELKGSAAPRAIARKTTTRKGTGRRKAKPAAEKSPPKAAAAKTVKTRRPRATTKPVKSKEAKTMTTKKKQDTSTMAKDMTKTFQAAMADVSDRTKAAYHKGNEFLADAGAFAKGNVEATVESGKVLAQGMQDMSREAISEGRADFEQFTTEVKELAAVKSPTDFFQLQSAMMRRYFDKAVATSAKNTEAMIKLANDAAVPIQNRVSLAVDKVRAA